MCSQPPKPPDPKETGAASEGTNIGTAIANASLHNVNQVTPEGNLTYKQTGTHQFTDPYTGQSYAIPTYTATQTLSKAGAATQAQVDKAKLGLGTTANELLTAAHDNLATPVDLSAANLDKYSNTHFLDDFTRQWDKSSADEEQSLTNRGIRLGSDAYTKAHADFSTERGNALDNMLGSEQANARTSILAEHDQPLNELTALMTGSQVSHPNYVNTSEPTIPTTDMAGLINQNYSDKVSAYNTQQQQMGGLFGGLFKLGASFLL